MEQKDGYKPKEVVRIAEAYARIKRASEGVLDDQMKRHHFINTYLPEFQRDVPENVRKQMEDIEFLVKIIRNTQHYR